MTPADLVVIHAGLNDHGLIFAFRKISVVRKTENTVHFRKMKKFDAQKFVTDWSQQHWESVYLFAETPNSNLEIWKKLLLQAFVKQAPLQHINIRTGRIAWITSCIKELMNKSDKLKRKANITNIDNDSLIYKKTMNEVNLELRNSKKDYYSAKIAGDRCNSKEAWKTINNFFRKIKQINFCEWAKD